MSRRYALDQEESTTTVASETAVLKQSSSGLEQQANTNNDNKPTRLYPDLGAPAGDLGSQQQQPPPAFGSLPPTMRGPTPFLPFGPKGIPSSNPGPLNANYQPHSPFNNNINQNRPPADVFSSTLGERLLKLANGGSTPANASETRQALQNATVLDQLNKGVHSVYDNLAKAYNATIQRQVELLQDRVRNNTNINAWQHNWAEQVSQFYKSMADRANQAQQNLNAAWERMKNANATELQKSLQQQQRSLQNPFGNLQALQDDLSSNNFMPRSLNLQAPSSLDQMMPNMGSSDNMFGGQTTPQRDMTTQLREFWNTQVRPQMTSARNMIARTWHDLTASGAYSPFQTSESMISSRSSNNNNMATPSATSNGDFVDSILSMVNLNGPEYSMIDQENNSSSNRNDSSANGMMNNMQNNMVVMQREINQLWKGLTNSLQSTMDNMRRRMMIMMMNQGNKDRKPNNNSSDVAASSTNDIERMDPDPAENEISAKLKDINSLQKDADRVYDAVQREQYNQKLQQEQQSVSERLKNFYNNLKIDENVHKIGNVVNDFWANIPDRWNNIMGNMRQQSSSTAKPAK